jgi:hypothetical protein
MRSENSLSNVHVLVRDRPADRFEPLQFELSGEEADALLRTV